jgi:hypothetical protein
MNTSYAFKVYLDPAPIMALEGFPESDRAKIAEAVQVGEIQLYGVIFTRECPDHGAECPHAEELDDDWGMAAQPGIEGVYRDCRDIPDEALQAVAYRLETRSHG